MSGLVILTLLACMIAATVFAVSRALTQDWSENDRCGGNSGRGCGLEFQRTGMQPAPARCPACGRRPHGD